MARKAKLKQGFYWRNDTVWLRTDPVSGKPISTRCHDPAAAEFFRAERERLAADPSYAASRSATLRRWIAITLEAKTAQRRPASVQMYRSKLGHWARIFGEDATLAQVGTSAAVDRYLAQRATERVTNSTLSKELVCFKQLLKLAKRGGEFAGDIEAVFPVGFRIGYVPRTRTISAADVPKLLSALRDRESRAWVCFALAFAADESDIHRSRPEHYDRAAGLVYLDGTKTFTRAARLPILPHVAELAREALEFLEAYGRIYWPRASKGVGEACKRAGLSNEWEGITDLTHAIAETEEMSSMEEMVVVAREKLPLSQREVLILNAYSGYTFEEIAQMTGESHGAVRTRAWRARTQLKRIVAALIELEDNRTENEGRTSQSNSEDEQ